MVLASGARAALAIQPSGGVTLGSGSSTTGWSFQTTQTLYVTALDARVNAISTTHLVNLYDSALNILATANVTDADPLVGSPVAFWSHAITPVTLQANTVYYVSESSNTSVDNVAYNATLAVDPALVYLGNVFSPSNHALSTAPVSNFPNGFFGANFEFSTTPVPEPSSLGLLSVCALGTIAHVRWRRARDPRP